MGGVQASGPVVVMQAAWDGCRGTAEATASSPAGFAELTSQLGVGSSGSGRSVQGLSACW